MRKGEEMGKRETIEEFALNEDNYVYPITCKLRAM